MGLFSSAKSSDTPQSNGSDNSDFFQDAQTDAGRRDVMCLVYPDGRTTTVASPDEDD